MSAVFTGTAAGHVDLLNKIVGHMTDAGTLGGEVWQLLTSRNVSGEEERYMKGPGLAGTDEIYVNLYTYTNVGADIYNILFRGASSHNAAFVMALQPGSSPPAIMPTWQNAIPYTLVVSGRRIIVITKVSTTYSHAYAGFYIPYATSAENPYPLFVGANTFNNYRWSQGTYYVGSFFDPAGNQATVNNAGAWLRHFDGTWVCVANSYDQSGTRALVTSSIQVWPWQFADAYQGQNYGGGYSILQAVLNGVYSGVNVYGELQGVYYVSGFANAAENTITISGKTYLVTQSFGRNARNDYAAILLE